MKGKNKKKKAYSNKRQQYEIRDYIADRLVKGGITPEKFNKIIGIGKNEK